MISISVKAYPLQLQVQWLVLLPLQEVFLPETHLLLSEFITWVRVQFIFPGQSITSYNTSTENVRQDEFHFASQYEHRSRANMFAVNKEIKQVWHTNFGSEYWKSIKRVNGWFIRLGHSEWKNTMNVTHAPINTSQTERKRPKSKFMLEKWQVMSLHNILCVCTIHV